MIRNVIATYKFDWYLPLGVKLVDSWRAYEYWAGKSICHRQYAFKFKKSIFCPSKLVEILIYFEKTIMQSAQMELPLYLDNLIVKEAQGLREFDYIKFMEKPGTIYRKFDDNILINMSELAEVEERRSLIFQRRIPWELTSDEDFYYIYGRFSAGIV